MPLINYLNLIGCIAAITGAALASCGMPNIIVFCFASIAALIFMRHRYAFLLFIFASFILLYPIEALPADFLYSFLVHIIDPFVYAFIFITVFFHRSSPSTLIVPRHAIFLCFLGFVSYNCILLFKYTTAIGFSIGLFELRKYFYSLFVVYCIYFSGFRHKKLAFLLLFIIALSVIGGVFNTAGYLYRFLIIGTERLYSRNLIQASFYYSQAFLACCIALSYFTRGPIRTFLIISMIFLFLSIIVDQTRGFWISTMAAICLYAILFLPIRRFFNIRTTLYILMSVIIAVILSVIFKINLLDIVTSRFKDVSDTEMINPMTSGGYRIYESFIAVSQTNFFGHGLKAPLRLFLPFWGREDDWYGIHSQYVDILYCTGIVGLSLFLVFSVIFIRQAYKLAKNPNIHRAFWGKIVLFSYINTLIVSITSGFFIRFSSCLFLGFTIVLLMVFQRRHVQ